VLRAQCRLLLSSGGAARGSFAAVSAEEAMTIRTRGVGSAGPGRRDHDGRMRAVMTAQFGSPWSGP
jgi:hypothetical protein